MAGNPPLKNHGEVDLHMLSTLSRWSERYIYSFIQMMLQTMWRHAWMTGGMRWCSGWQEESCFAIGAGTDVANLFISLKRTQLLLATEEWLLAGLAWSWGESKSSGGVGGGSLGAGLPYHKFVSFALEETRLRTTLTPHPSQVLLLVVLPTLACSLQQYNI